MRVPKSLSIINKNRWMALAGLTGVAGLAIVNGLAARKAEKQHPPMGSFLTVAGVRLHYTDRGSGDPVVLIHGNAVSGNDWDTSGVAEILQQTHRVIIFDRPGYGYSERPRGRLWTAAEQAELLYQALQQLEVKCPVVVGHSFGAIVALAFAVRYQAEMSGLVLLSGYYFWTLRVDALQAAVGAAPILGDLLHYTISPLVSLAQIPFLKRMMFSPANITTRFQTEYSSAMAVRPSQLRASSIDAALMIPSVISLRPHYEQLNIPVIIISGDADKIVSKTSSERLQKIIAGSVMHIIAGAGHMVHHFAPDEVSNAVKKLEYNYVVSSSQPSTQHEGEKYEQSQRANH